MHTSPPTRGTELDLRDPDGIWSIATVVKVIRKTSRTYDVVLQYSGWDNKWNERVSWEDDVRLARLFTYTRRVRALVKIFHGTKKGSNSESSKLWPCRIFFRMPHPGNQAAAALLRLEPKILVKPYFPEFISNRFYVKLEDHGLWLKTVNLCPFDVSTVMRPREGFIDACKIALADCAGTPGFMPSIGKVVEVGTSLLCLKYRVSAEPLQNAKSRFPFDGCLSSTNGSATRDDLQNQAHVTILLDALMSNGTFDFQSTGNSTSSTAIVKKEGASKFDDAKILASKRKKEEFPKVDRPPLPETCSIPQTESEGVRRSCKSNTWIASSRRRGIDFIIGHFSSKSLAMKAREIALGSEQVELLKKDTDYILDDLKQVDMNTLISARGVDEKRKFSISKWALQLVQHKDYEMSKRQLENDSGVHTCEEQGETLTLAPSTQEASRKRSLSGHTLFSGSRKKRKKRKQSNPKRIQRY